MGVFETTEKQLNRDKQLEPDWYDWEITDVEDKPSKTDGTNNCWVTCEGIGETNRYVQVSMCSNEKWSPILIPFIKGGLQLDPAAGDKFDFDKKLIGRQFSAFNQPKIFENKMRNNLVDFRPLGS